jgi:hypothetical protein
METKREIHIPEGLTTPEEKIDFLMSKVGELTIEELKANIEKYLPEMQKRVQEIINKSI